MYKYEDFEDRFGEHNSLEYLLDIYKKMLLTFTTTAKTYITTEEAISGVGGDSWMMLAAIDKLEELRYIRCIDNSGARNYWRYVVCL
jgi:hypothetical protein